MRRALTRSRRVEVAGLLKGVGTEPILFIDYRRGGGERWLNSRDGVYVLLIVGWLHWMVESRHSRVYIQCGQNEAQMYSTDGSIKDRRY